MTYEQAMELVERLVACKRFRWMPGMLAMVQIQADVWTEVRVTHVSREWLQHSGDRRIHADRCLPDFNDPATVGCLLALVREVWGPHAHMTWAQYETGAEEWICWVSESRVFLADTEAEALVAALEAAPHGE